MIIPKDNSFNKYIRNGLTIEKCGYLTSRNKFTIYINVKLIFHTKINK